MAKPSIPRGTRDFPPEQVKKRQYIINTIREVYEQYGYQAIETPAMEQLSTLTGKYGEEGDRLLFRVLNQGEKIRKADVQALTDGNLPRFAASLAERGLRYDLTIPFARYVVMNRNNITFPFKRYQIQPVWRGDKPQKGRYREFWQCDADVVGTTSLLNEVELTQIYDTVFKRLQVPVNVLINNRKVLQGIADYCGCSDKIVSITVAIDKLDKIGESGVKAELIRKGLTDSQIESVFSCINLPKLPAKNKQVFEVLQRLKHQFETGEGGAISVVGSKGIDELLFVFEKLNKLHLHNDAVFDPSLARGLDYYTGIVFECKLSTNRVKMGSIGGGGRYDDLTSVFGLKNVSGVGISFGLDRIYDVMNELNLFHAVSLNTSKVLFLNFGGAAEEYAFSALQHFRQATVSAEIYPDAVKLKKQMKYANARNIPFVVFTGEAEMAKQLFKIKNMVTGEQFVLDISQLLDLVVRS